MRDVLGRGVVLNIDAGELDDEPDALYAAAHLVSIACGGHAGDESSMERALRACKAHGTRAGAHPSYEDREGFGRREKNVGAGELESSVRSQCARLGAIARVHGVSLEHVKPHGALYHAADGDAALARAVVEGARAALGAPVVVGPPEGELARAAAAAGLAFAREGFADRGTRPDGSLVPRGEPGAMVTDPAAARRAAATLARSGRFDTLCVHGDTTGAVAIARAVREELDAIARAAR